MAITGFILSLLWLGGLGSLAGLCLGAIAMRRTRQRNQAGRGLAIAALILGIVGVLGTASLIGALLLLGRLGESENPPGISGSIATPTTSAPGISGEPTSAPTGVGVVPVDQAKVAALALLPFGAAQFNLGNLAEAESTWLVAARLYPESAEVHYDLGFLYMSQSPPDSARMIAEWKKVVAIDPSSELAKTVATHLADANSGSSGTPSPK